VTEPNDDLEEWEKPAMGEDDSNITDSTFTERFITTGAGMLEVTYRPLVYADEENPAAPS